ncbi:MAG TPA: YnbE family lipoprotein [Porticoccaceae bacterium]
MRKLLWSGLALLVAPLLLACSPTVRVETPTEPITINLNVKIDHEIRVKVDRELEGLFSEDSDLF